MAKSDTRGIRLLFQTGNLYRQFCWFRQRGDDLYWGSSSNRTIKGAVASVGEQSTTITVPDEIEMVEEGPLKASFHASGQFHIRRAGKMLNAPEHWRLKNEVKAPYRIAALISKHPKLYKPYPSSRSLMRGRTSAQVIRLKREEEATRHYYEFFVSPAGRFIPPPPLLAVTIHSGEPQQQPLTFSLNEHLILITRQFVFRPSSGFSKWHPELELWFHGIDESNDSTGSN